MNALVDAMSLVKRFGTAEAVAGVSLCVPAGEVLGFLGPNGAGKTTTMRMITGYLIPDEGEVIICGKRLASESEAAKAHIGYLPEGAPLYPEMNALQFLRFCGGMHGMSKSKLNERLDFVIEQLHLSPVLNQPLGTLSKGFKRRVGLAQAILHDPDVLILDEPTDGLDPIQKGEVRELIREMAKDKAIIISTHILEEVDAVCSRVVMIDNGKIIADGTPDALLEETNHNHLEDMFIDVVNISRGESGYENYAEGSQEVEEGLKSQQEAISKQEAMEDK